MKIRKSLYGVHPFIVQRWSPRAMDPRGELSFDELMRLFEAASWAQSSYNGQPWRFIYALRNSAYWQLFFDLMVPFNQSWTQAAAVLVVVISRNTFSYNNEPSRTHSFDTGAACQNMALQGAIDGLVVHGMEGFDYDKARAELHVPDGYTVEAMFAIGKRGQKERLPKELQEREEPSLREPLAHVVFEGVFKE